MVLPKVSRREMACKSDGVWVAENGMVGRLPVAESVLNRIIIIQVKRQVLSFAWFAPNPW